MHTPLYNKDVSFVSLHSALEHFRDIFWDTFKNTLGTPENHFATYSLDPDYFIYIHKTSSYFILDV